MCHSELRSIEKNLNKFIDAGIRVVGISVDTPEKTRDYMLRKAGYTFTFLSDTKLEVLRRYDLGHEGFGTKGAEIARPAEFLLDSSGTIRWRMITDNFFRIARPEQILEAAKALP
jgi:peroxiredoxin